MKLINLISEIEYRTFSTVVRIIFRKKSGIVEVADIIRALPGVTRVSIADSDEDAFRVDLNVKLITQKSAKEAFEMLKKNAIERYSASISKVQVAVNNIEEI